MNDKPKKVYMSNSGFMWGRVVFTDYKSGCIRNILLSANGVREGEINKKYQVLGELNEERYEAYLKSIGANYVRELAVKHPITPDSEVVLSGRIDFLRQLTGFVEVDELKSTDSTNKRREVIKKGKWVTENLAQAISYMISMECVTGRLVYTYYEMDDITKQYEPRDERAFEIMIESSGRISVDGTPTQFSVNDQLNHRLAAKTAIETHTVWDRPYNWDKPFQSPCKFCPWSSTCDKYDDGKLADTDAFIHDAKISLNKVKETK